MTTSGFGTFMTLLVVLLTIMELSPKHCYSIGSIMKKPIVTKFGMSLGNYKTDSVQRFWFKKMFDRFAFSLQTKIN